IEAYKIGERASLYVMAVKKQEANYSMQEKTTSSQWPEKLTPPRRITLFFPMIKTFKMILAFLKDRRIPVIRKKIFFGSILFLLVLLFFPDLFGEVVLSFVLPLVGTVLGIPIDAGFDWVVFAIAVVSLLRVFPAEMVSEHYKRIFHKR